MPPTTLEAFGFVKRDSKPERAASPPVPPVTPEVQVIDLTVEPESGSTKPCHSPKPSLPTNTHTRGSKPFSKKSFHKPMPSLTTHTTTGGKHSSKPASSKYSQTPMPSRTTEVTTPGSNPSSMENQHLATAFSVHSSESKPTMSLGFVLVAGAKVGSPFPACVRDPARRTSPSVCYCKFSPATCETRKA